MYLHFIGLGKVGSRTRNFIEDAACEKGNVDLTTTFWDERPESMALDEIPDWIIISLPTDTVDGKCDVTEILHYLERLPPQSGIILRSTVPPEFWTHKNCNYPLVYWPEFYSWISGGPESFPVVLGSDDRTLRDQFLEDFWFIFPSTQRFEFCDLKTASLAKYAVNAHLKQKMALARRISDYAASCGADYQIVRQIVGADPRIGISHLQTEGWPLESHCLEKDWEVLASRLNMNPRRL